MSALARGVPSGMRARHDLRAHGVGDHVLQHDADDDQELGHDVELLGRREA